MTIVDVHEAKARLSALIAEVEHGGAVVIARAGRPVVRLVAVGRPTSPRHPGALRGRVWLTDDFDAYDAEIDRLFMDESM